MGHLLKKVERVRGLGVEDEDVAANEPAMPNESSLFMASIAMMILLMFVSMTMPPESSLKRYLQHLPVEDQVELTYVFEAPVQHLHKHLDEVQNAKLALVLVHDEHKVERGVVSVDNPDVLRVCRVRLLEKRWDR